MSLLDTMDKLGTLALKGMRKAIKPVSFAIVVLALSYNVSAHSSTESDFNKILPEQAISQVQPDTLWGSGGFRTRTENNDPLGNVKLSVTPLMMETIVPDTTYEFITNGAGEAPFTLETYIDTLTSLNNRELNRELNKPEVFPTIGNEINAFFPEPIHGDISIVNALGQQVANKEISGDNVYMSLERFAEGLYAYIITTQDNQVFAGKVIKQDLAVNGPAQRPVSSAFKESAFKNITFQDFATYKIKYEKEDWLSDSTEIDIYTGENGNFFFYLEETPLPPATHDISGYFQDGNNNLAKIANATAIAEHINTGTFHMVESDETGYYIIKDLLVQDGQLGEPQEYKLHFGGVNAKYSFANFSYLTPIFEESTWSASDTLNDNFDIVLMDKDPLTSADHIVDQNLYGWLSSIVKFFVGDTFETPERKEKVRKFVSDYNDLEPGSYNFVEVFSEVTEGGFNIEFGTYNTNPSGTAVITPIGDTLKPKYFANVSMGLGDSIGAYHEFKQALGYHQVSWTNGESVLESPSEVYSIEDNAIANISNPYWKYVYQDSATWIPLRNIVENIDDKKEQALQQKSIKTNIDNYFNSSSSSKGVKP